MCSTDCAYDNSTIILIGDVYCPNIKCSGRLCLHKKTFESLGRSDYQCPQCGSVCQVRNITFEDQINSFFLSLGQGVHIFKERSKSVQEVIGDVYCPGEFCLNREKCESLGGHVTTPRSIYGCGKCGALVVCSQSSFYVTRTRKDDKNRQNTILLCQKRCYPTNNFYLMSHLKQPNIERENCVWTKKYERLSEMCIVQHVETKSVFTFQPIHRLVSTTVRSAKPAATF